MRITVDLDDDLLMAVEQRRTACKTTGQVLADLARQALRAPDANPVPVRGTSTGREDEDWIPTLSHA